MTPGEREVRRLRDLRPEDIRPGEAANHDS